MRGGVEGENGAVDPESGGAGRQAGREGGDLQEGEEGVGDVLSESAVARLELLLAECVKGEQAMQELLGEIAEARASLVDKTSARPSSCSSLLSPEYPALASPPFPYFLYLLHACVLSLHAMTSSCQQVCGPSRTAARLHAHR